MFKKLIKNFSKGALNGVKELTPITVIESAMKQLSTLKAHDLNGDGKIERWEVVVQLTGKALAVILSIVIAYILL